MSPAVDHYTNDGQNDDRKPADIRPLVKGKKREKKMWGKAAINAWANCLLCTSVSSPSHRLQ